MTALPARLREAREAAALSQKQLGKLSGVDAGRISRIESAKRLRGIEAAIIVRLAVPLGVHAGWLLTGKPPRFPQTMVLAEPGVALDIVEAVRAEVRALLPGRIDQEKAKARRPRNPAQRPQGNPDKPR